MDDQPKAFVIAAMVVGVLAVACSGSSAAPEASPSPSVVTVTETASASPPTEPEVTLATIRGPFNGTCVLVKSVGPIDSSDQRQPTHWKFRPQSDQKLTLFSKSGGYTMKLDRTSPTKFYGTVIQGNGWQFAYAIKIGKFDSDGSASTIQAVTHDTAPGGAAKASYICRLRAGGAD